MTMTDLNGKIEDTIITLNKIAPRRSFSDDERFLSDLITSYRELQKDNAVSVKAVNGFIGLVRQLREAKTELLEALKQINGWANAEICNSSLPYSPALNEIRGKAQEAITKHSTDTEVKE